MGGNGIEPLSSRCKRVALPLKLTNPSIWGSRIRTYDARVKVERLTTWLCPIFLEGVGFEPTITYVNGFTVHRFKPLSHPLKNGNKGT